MYIDEINNGIVIDHIEAGKSMEIALPVTLSDGKECIGTFIVNYSVDDLVVFQENFRKNCGTICLFILLFGSMYAFAASGRMTRPIRKITNSVHQVTEGYMEEGLSIQSFVRANENNRGNETGVCIKRIT